MRSQGRSDGRNVRNLADLARGAMAITEQPGTQINFQVHHVTDRPNYLSSHLANDVESHFRETVSANMHGATVIIGTDRGPLAPEMRARHQGGSNPVRVRHETNTDGAVFVGAARPNPSFIYESAERFEFLIAIETQQMALKHVHGQAVKQVIAKIAQIAALHAHAPILSLQTPVQLPTSRHFENVEELDRTERWGSPSVVAVRAVLALQEATCAQRVGLVSRLTQFCVSRGFGLWIANQRLDHSSGNWYSVLPADGARLRDHLSEFRRVAVKNNAPIVSCPLTLVGPARVGSTSSVLAFLTRAKDVGIMGCSVSALDDLAFIHLQLTGPNVDEKAVAKLAESEPDGVVSLTDALHRVVEALGGKLRDVTSMDGWGDEMNPSGRLEVRAGDYQLLAGPANRLQKLPGLHRKSIWFAWRQVGLEHGIFAPIEALTHALADCGFKRDDEATIPNLEYLICRDLGAGVHRGKGKLTLSELSISDSDSVEHGPSKLCSRIEDAWRSRLVESGGAAIEPCVAWREFWLRLSAIH